MAYSYAQLEGLWIQAGGNPSSAPIAAAVALAESGGNPNAFNGSDPSGGSRGLWQINGVHGGQSTFDVLSNAKAAVSISSNGTNWSPWSTYTSGAYQRFMQSGVSPQNVNGLPVSATGTPASSSSSDCCAIGFGGVSVPIIGSQGSFCILSKSQVNSMVGILLIGAGLMVASVGVGWILVYALQKGVGAAGKTPIGSAALGATGVGRAAQSVATGKGLAKQVQRHTPARATGGKVAPKPEPLRLNVGNDKKPQS